MQLLRSRSIYVALLVATFGWLGGVNPAAAQDDNTQISELYKLQAAYHRAATVRDPVNGDSFATITARLREVLSLFTADAVLHLTIGSAQFDGYYVGNGDPDTTHPPAPHLPAIPIIVERCARFTST